MPDPSSAPGLFELMEDSLIAPVRPLATFENLARRPAPSWPAMLANTAFFSAAFLAINLAHAFAAFPGMISLGPAAAGLLGALFLALMLLSLAAAVCVHGLSRLAGGKGAFSRSAQLVSVAASCLILQAGFNWFPDLWPVPFLAALVMIVVGAQCLHETSKIGAWIVFGMSGALLTSALWLGRSAVERYAARLVAPPPISEEPNPAAPDERAPQVLPAQAPAASSLQPLILGNMNAAPMSANPGAAPPSGANPAQLLPPDAAQAMTAMGDQLLGMLNDPNFTKGMPPAQAKQFKEMTALLNKMKNGKNLSPAERQALLGRMQQITRQMADDAMAQAMKNQAKNQAGGKP